MVKKIDGKPLWSKSPSGEMIYGKEINKETKERYQKENLNEIADGGGQKDDPTTNSENKNINSEYKEENNQT